MLVFVLALRLHALVAFVDVGARAVRHVPVFRWRLRPRMGVPPLLPLLAPRALPKDLIVEVLPERRGVLVRNLLVLGHSRRSLVIVRGLRVVPER